MSLISRGVPVTRHVSTATERTVRTSRAPQPLFCFGFGLAIAIGGCGEDVTSTGEHPASTAGASDTSGLPGAPTTGATTVDAGVQTGGDAATTGPAPTTSGAGSDAGARNEGGASDDATAGDGGEPTGPRFPAVDDLSQPGPFETNDPNGEAEGPNCSVHRPATLGEEGLKHPVILWGMGTGGFNLYQPAFDLWASHGFIVAAGLSGHGQGSGEEMLGCLEHVCQTYAPHVDCRAGASGHSQGGGGAIMAGRDPRVITTAPVQPYILEGFGGFEGASIEQQAGPMLLLSGTLDTVATPAANQQPVFDTTNVAVFWANAVGVDHVGPGVDGAAAYREVILAWFRLQLMGDESFRPMFHGPSCSLCGDDAWEVQRRGLN